MLRKTLISLVLASGWGLLPTPSTATPRPTSKVDQTKLNEPSPEQIATAMATVRKARSAAEATAALRVLQGGEAGPARLAKLLDEKLAPEVELAALSLLLRAPGPVSAEVAGRSLSSRDPLVRKMAARSLTSHSTPQQRTPLKDACLKEKDPSVLGFLLSALGTTGADKGTVEFLERYLRPDAEPAVLHGAAWGLGAIGADGSVPKLLRSVPLAMERITLNGIFISAHKAMGPQPVERLLSIASKPADPYLLWALDRIGHTDYPDLDLAMKERLATAAASHLDDEPPMVRAKALQALANSPGVYPFLTDLARLEQITDRIKSDPDPKVRMWAIEALHDTVMRRGLVFPGGQPPPVEPMTMRMLRWPADWVTFPALIGALSDPQPDVQQYAVWMLGISTGYWHGFANIGLPGTALVAAPVIRPYEKMWNEMAQTNPVEYTRDAIDRVLKDMVNRLSPESHLAWMTGVSHLSGRDFGWGAAKSPVEKEEALVRAVSWWTANADKHPVEWIADSVREVGFTQVGDASLHVLARWGFGEPPAALTNRSSRMREPEKSQESFNTWWETIRGKIPRVPREPRP